MGCEDPWNAIIRKPLTNEDPWDAIIRQIQTKTHMNAKRRPI